MIPDQKGLYDNVNIRFLNTGNMDESIERLKRLDNDKLLDVVKNHKRYDYKKEIRDYAIAILNDKGYTIGELDLFGYLKNNDYDEAEKQFNSFRRNSKIALFTFVSSGGLLIIVYIIFIYMAHYNQKCFYQALGRKYEYCLPAVFPYFHIRDKMREELKGFR